MLQKGVFLKYSMKWGRVEVGIFQQQIVTTLLRRAWDTTLRTISPKFYLNNLFSAFFVRLLYLCGIGAAKGFLFQYQSKSKFFFFLLLPRVSLWKSLRNPWSEVSKYFPTKIHWNLAPAVQQPNLELANQLSKFIQFSKILECEDEEILWMATDCFKSRDARVHPCMCASWILKASDIRRWLHTSLFFNHNLTRGEGFSKYTLLEQYSSKHCQRRWLL